jgi:hypothetical protein
LEGRGEDDRLHEDKVLEHPGTECFGPGDHTPSGGMPDANQCVAVSDDTDHVATEEVPVVREPP